MGNSKERRQLRRLLLRMGHSPMTQSVAHQVSSPPPPQSKSARSNKAVLTEFWAGIGLLWKMVGVIGLFVSLLATFALQPQLSVEEKDYSLNPSDPMQTPFIVKNNGVFPLYEV